MTEHQLIDGDIVLWYTDGFSDNLFIQDIAKFFARVDERQLKVSAEETFKSVMRQAVKISAITKDDKLKTPFGESAKKYNYKWTGGKMDDITLMALFVTETKSSL